MKDFDQKYKITADLFPSGWKLLKFSILYEGRSFKKTSAYKKRIKIILKIN